MTQNQLFSQEPKTYSYTTEQGLLSNEVYNIHQDQSGKLWFATDMGVSVFDGKKFHPILGNNTVSGSVYRFYPQSNGTVWFVDSKNQLFYFYPSRDVVYSFPFNDSINKYSLNGTSNCLVVNKEGIKLSFWNIAGFIQVDFDGNVIRTPFSFRKERLFILKTKDGLVYGDTLLRNRNDQVLDTINGHSSNYHYYSENNRNYIVSNFQTSKLYASNGRVIEINENKRPLSNGWLDSSHFWIGYLYGGIKFYTTSGKPINHILKASSPTFIHSDHQGAYWISTLDKGLKYLPSIGSISFEQMSESGPTHILIDSAKIIVACSNGDIFEIQGDSVRLKFESKTKYPSHLLELNDMALFFQDGRFFDNTGKSHFESYDTKSKIFRLSEWTKKLVVLANRTGINIMSNDTLREVLYPQPGIVRDIHIQDNEIYVAHQSAILQLNTNDDQFVEFLDVSQATAVHSYKSLVFVGTAENGVKVYNDTSFVSWISSTFGLPSNHVSCITSFSDDELWIGTDNGVGVLNRKNGKYTIQKIDVSNGLNSGYVKNIQFVDDRVVITTFGGISILRRGDVFISDRRHQMFYLTKGNSLVNNSKKHSLSDLSYEENNIILVFEAISFVPDKRLTFRYKINNENRWSYLTDNQLHLKALESGDYHVIIQAGLEGNWSSEQLDYHIHISSPFYQTSWFWILFLVVVSVLIFISFKYKFFQFNKEIAKSFVLKLVTKLIVGPSYFTIQDGKKKIRFNSKEILYVKAARNYTEIYYSKRKFLVRMKISDFIKNVPDQQEYVRIHRSYIVRIDKIESIMNDTIVISGVKFQIGSTFRSAISEISKNL